MFGMTFEKLLMIGVIAVFLLGPERLPHYAAQLARLVRSLREMANGARERMKDEMGEDLRRLTGVSWIRASTIPVGSSARHSRTLTRFPIVGLSQHSGVRRRFPMHRTGMMHRTVIPTR